MKVHDNFSLLFCFHFDFSAFLARLIQNGNYAGNRVLNVWASFSVEGKEFVEVENIVFGNEKDLVNYCGGIQSASPVDSASKPIPWDMPGYTDKIVMASGSFTQGSSIELSCDGPVRKPYIAYQQGSLTYSYGKIAVMKAVSNLINSD